MVGSAKGWFYGGGGSVRRVLPVAAGFGYSVYCDAVEGIVELIKRVSMCALLNDRSDGGFSFKFSPKRNSRACFVTAF